MTDDLIGQPMFQLLKKARQVEKAGRKILHFEIGDSDFGSFLHIREATKEALDKDYTHYVDSAGIIELREAIADHIEETLLFRPGLEQIVVLPANAVIDFVIRCVAESGEQVIFPDPSFSTYIAVASYNGVEKVPVPLKEENAFHLDPEQVARRITDKTRLLIINSPHNPTGAVLDKDEIKEIYHIAKERDIFILSDEVYSRVIYNKSHYSPATFDKCKERTIILNGFSKSYSMAGWRLGYAIGPGKLAEKITLLFQTIYSCSPHFTQYAGIAALKDNQHLIEGRIGDLKRLRNLIVKELSEIPGLTCSVPDGAYYVFPNISGTGMTSTEFADFALEKAGVALLPGTCFGQYGEGYVRLCFAKKPEVIRQACAKIREALGNRKSPIKVDTKATFRREVDIPTPIR